MFSALRASVDRRIADAIVNSARRRWPPLRLVPAAWIRPLAKPAATHVRRELWRAALPTAVVGVLIAGLLVAGGL
jgi:hypothetical protein